MRSLRHMAVLLAGALTAALALQTLAGQIDSATFFGLRRGMSESEILVRAGPPDLVTLPGGKTIEVTSASVVQGDDGSLRFDAFQRTEESVMERWHYIPAHDEPDPFITVISIRGGEVWELQRTKVFSRARREAPQALAVRGAKAGMTDEEILGERIDRTLRAARDYAATRARLKEEAGAASPSGSKTTVYRHVDGDGSVYFGDRPPGPLLEYVEVE